jgi:hypothetical protein
MKKQAALLIVLILSAQIFAENEMPNEQKWDLKEICRLESTDYWTGPFDKEDITVSTDAVEGKHSIQVNLDIEPGHNIRIEKNFVADCHEGFRNMMAFGMIDEDFSPYRTISFDYKTDVNNIDKIIFRVYDREGGWLQWLIPSPGNAKEWTKITLAVPPKTLPEFNKLRTGGVIWEITAGSEPVKGKIRLDNLQLITDGKGGIEGTSYRPKKIDHRMAINPPAVKSGYCSDEIHLVMNMTGEVGYAIASHDTEMAIKTFSESVRVFKDVPGLEFFFAPEAWRVKLKPSEEELSSGKCPDPKQWQAKTQEVYVAMAKWCEDNKVPFYAGIGMSGDHKPVIPAETIEACIQAAPQYCRGSLMGEFSIESNQGIDLTVDVLKVLKKYNRKLLYFNRGAYWYGIMMPHGNKFREMIFTPEFKDVFVPMGEYVGPETQALSFSTLIGLWRSGMAGDWGVSAQSWQYANLNWGGTSDQPGDIWLRMFLSVASFGGRYIEIEPKWAFDGENVPGQVTMFKQWAHNLRWVGKRRAQIDIDLDPGDPMRALILFNRLVRSNALKAAASPEKVVSISPVVFQVEHKDGWDNWGLFHRAVDKKFFDGCCPNYTQMSAQVPAYDAFSYLYSSNQFYDQILPLNDYGLVSILPAQARLKKHLIQFSKPTQVQ